jgi:hypothetical protein
MGYTTMDARVGGRFAKRLEVSLWGRNLFDRQHAEFITTNSLNDRSAAVKLTFRP